MNLWLRFLWLMLKAPMRQRLAMPDAVSRLDLRVWLNDLDINGHVNNGRYWTLFDLGRIDLLLRGGLAGIILKNRWTPVVGAGAIRFRRELKPFQPFELETRIVGWVETRVIFEHRILIGPERSLAARGLVLGGVYDRKTRAFVPVDILLQRTGATDTVSPEPDAAARGLLDLEDMMKEDGHR